ncbi:hypothetical protein CVT25_006315 [Psilocybe cyanescens]|uniref:Uncharacterized protein n=1 Tax=Psilocybe cyanescens TaxID=93625 RepID=A0A409WYP8_PSICY|nr:hypothetical protein CVT25_006315 [Psilocybe cyanescens]
MSITILTRSPVLDASTLITVITYILGKMNDMTSRDVIPIFSILNLTLNTHGQQLASSSGKPAPSRFPQHRQPSSQSISLSPLKHLLPSPCASPAPSH